MLEQLDLKLFMKEKKHARERYAEREGERERERDKIR